MHCNWAATSGFVEGVLSPAEPSGPVPAAELKASMNSMTVSDERTKEIDSGQTTP